MIPIIKTLYRYILSHGQLSYHMSLSPHLPAELIHPLAEKAFFASAIALNTITPPDVLDKLSMSNNSSVRRGVADNLSTPPRVLARLSQDPDTYVVNPVARNPNTPPEVLDKLSRLNWPSVSLDLVYNPSTPPEVLQRLRCYGYERSERPVGPIDQWSRLVYDGDPLMGAADYILASLCNLAPIQLSTVLTLFPDWESTVEELVETAKLLTEAGST